jgi:hypothetical protein
VPAPEAKKEEAKKDELVQSQTEEKKPSQDTAPDTVPNTGTDSTAVETGKDTRDDVPVSTKQTRQGVIQDWVNIRTQRYRASETVAKLPPGTTVEVIEVEQWFARVRYERKEGWIPIQFIKVHNNNNKHQGAKVK